MALSPPDTLKSELEIYCRRRGISHGCVVFKVVGGKVRKTEVVEYFLEDEVKKDQSLRKSKAGK